MKFIQRDSLDSTNIEALKLSLAGEPAPFWVRADEQTAGRGRRGRDWASPPGNFYATACYDYHGNPAEAAKVSFVAAIAVAKALSAYPLKHDVGLKWPNDILVDGKKIAGLLLEFREGCLLVGIGVNLTNHPKDTRLPATHLLEQIQPDALDSAEPIFTGAAGFLPILAAEFQTIFDVYLQQGFDPIRKAWADLAIGLPGPVTVRLPHETFTGEATNLAEDGALRVTLANGTVRYVHAGDVFFGEQ